jgi:CheY-like chemotaxis protein
MDVMSETGRGGRILIIDDEPVLLRAFRRMLEPAFEVVVAEGGRRALELLARDTGFDAVLCDLAMPEVDGTKVYRFLLEHAPALAPRIVFCTGGAFSTSSQEFFASVRNVFVEKPVMPATLRETLAEVIERAGRAPGGRGAS